MYPPIGECVRERWVSESEVYDCGRSVIREGGFVSPVKKVSPHSNNEFFQGFTPRVILLTTP
jgi:hypothetical protein